MGFIFLKQRQRDLTGTIFFIAPIISFLAKQRIPQRIILDVKVESNLPFILFRLLCRMLRELDRINIKEFAEERQQVRNALSL